MFYRKKFTKPGSWFKFTQEDRNQLKAGCLSSLVTEQEKSVRSALAQLVGTLAKHELGQRGGGWPELLQLILAKVNSEVGSERAMGVMLVSVLGEVAGEKARAGAGASHHHYHLRPARRPAVRVKAPPRDPLVQSQLAVGLGCF